MNEEEHHRLPCDVKVGHITFRKGTKISTLANRARAWWEIANDSMMGHTARAEIIRKHCGEE